MENNSKLLVIISLLTVVLGFSVLWFGLQPKPIISPSDSSLPESSSSAVVGLEGERVLVTEVVDGDTIKIEGGQTVRFLGIDTPETKDPRRPVGCFGKEASREVKNLLDGESVILEKDISDTDKYNRLLRYIYLPLSNGQTLFVNDYLVREGFAKALTYPPDVKFNEQLREAETFAKENKKGLWGRC